MKRERFFKGVILAAIFLSVIQIFLDEYSRYALRTVYVRNILVYAGFCFDVVFSVEFIIKIILALRAGKAALYWKHEGGLIDFISSFPLLILDLPAVYFLLTSHSFILPAVLYNVFVYIKNLDAARILRLLRVIKAFSKIQYGKSAMTAHHIAWISAAVISTIVCAFSVSTLLYSSVYAHRIFERSLFYDETISTIKYLEGKSGVAFKDIAGNIFSNEASLLRLIYKDEEIISKISEEKFNEYYTPEDYSSIKNRGFVIYYSVADIRSDIALMNIIDFIIIILVIVVIQTIYSRHFSRTASDVIKKIDSGFRLKQYNEPVNIRSEYAQDEVYKLAKFYNDAYLPAKLKRIAKEKENIAGDPVPGNEL